MTLLSPQEETDWRLHVSQRSMQRVYSNLTWRDRWVALSCPGPGASAPLLKTRRAAAAGGKSAGGAAGCPRLGLPAALPAPLPSPSRPRPRGGAVPDPGLGACWRIWPCQGSFFFSPLLALVTQPVALLHTIAGDKILLECG